MKSPNLLPVLFLLLCVACSSANQPAQGTQIPTGLQTPLALVTATPLSTDTPSPTDTPIPTPTDTSVPVVPSVTLDPTKAALVDLMGSMYFQTTIPPQDLQNPIGKPLTSWHDIPIMPQAVAGQEFNEHVYSYKAAATIDQAQKFYASNPKLMAIFAHAVPQSGANMHFFNFQSYELTISIVSQDNDPSQVTVIISRL